MSILYLSAVTFSSFVYYISIYIYPSLISGVHKYKAHQAAFGVITRFQQVCKVTFWNDKNITECWSRHVTSNKVSRSGERNINQRYSFVTTRCSDADKSRTRPRQYNRCQQIFADGTYISISILGEEIQDSFKQFFEYCVRENLLTPLGGTHIRQKVSDIIHSDTALIKLSRKTQWCQ